MARNKRKYSKEEVAEFGKTLSTTDPMKFTASDFKKVKEYCDSDGCTMVVDIYPEACWVHDFYYVTHRDFEGNEVSRSFADDMLKQLKQKLSILGNVSPMSWWRWAGVKTFGWIFW